MKCPNCGAENADGMKFCGECGTKLPEPMNHCPNCNKDWPLTMKFCGDCGFKFGGGSAAGSGALMGDKNVIAGDVNNTVTNNTSVVNNTTDNSSSVVNNTNNVNNTTVINSNETDKLAKCHICGSLQKITTGYECPVCHEYTCNSCFDVQAKMCPSCRDRSKNEAEKAVKMAAMDLSSRIKNDFDSVSNDEVLNYLKSITDKTSETFIEIQKKLAARYFEEESWERIISLYKLTPNNIDYHDCESLFMYGFALFIKDRDSAESKNILSISENKGSVDAAVLIHYQRNSLGAAQRSECFEKMMWYPANKFAQFYIGQLYETGWETLRKDQEHLMPLRDYAKALDWYKKSAAQGYKPAIAKAEELQNIVDKKNAADAQKRAEEEAKQEAEMKAAVEKKQIEEKNTIVKAAAKSQKEERMKQKIGGLLEKYTMEDICRAITCSSYFHPSFENYEYILKKFPEAHKMIAPVSGKWLGWKEGIKPLFKDAVKIQADGSHSFISVEIGKKVKEGEWIGITGGLLPEIDCGHDIKPGKGDDLPYSEMLEEYLSNNCIKMVDDLDYYYFGFIEKNEKFDEYNGKSLKSPVDGFLYVEIGDYEECGYGKEVQRARIYKLLKEVPPTGSN